MVPVDNLCLIMQWVAYLSVLQQIQAPLQQTGCLKNHLVLRCKLFLHSCLWLIKLTTAMVLVLAVFLLQRCVNLLYLCCSCCNACLPLSLSHIFVSCRFERLHLKCLTDAILIKYSEVLLKFSAEVDKTQKVLPTV